jgi:hypothetical protein
MLCCKLQHTRLDAMLQVIAHKTSTMMNFDVLLLVVAHKTSTMMNFDANLLQVATHKT